MTIIEVVVVAVILGLVAALTISRIVGGDGRRVAAKAEEVSQVLTALARRDAALSQTLALEFDRERDVLRIMVRNSDPTAREAWVGDMMLPEAPLGGVMVQSVEVDGAELDPASFRVVLDQYTPRPALRLVLTDTRAGNPHSVEMAGTAGQAKVLTGDTRGKGLSGSETASIDLDAAGKEREAW
jgi:type II secretory pathway pseudopilin PulG